MLQAHGGCCTLLQFLRTLSAQGLLPRASELLKLGLFFFLGFGPLVLGIAALSLALYLTFGEHFLHGGSTSRSIPYIDPYQLLGEPTVDPMVPLRSQEDSYKDVVGSNPSV